MREERTIQSSIFDVFSRHELGRELKAMSDLLDDHRQVCGWVAAELRRHRLKPTGRKGLPAETVLRQARQAKLESGEMLRVDSTVTDAPMHPPSDSSRLVLGRGLQSGPVRAPEANLAQPPQPMPATGQRPAQRHAHKQPDTDQSTERSNPSVAIYRLRRVCDQLLKNSTDSTWNVEEP